MVEHYSKKIGLLLRYISNSSAINKTDFTCPRGCGTPRSSIAETVARATLYDFPLDTILQPHCLAISAKLRKRQDNISGTYNYSELFSRCVRLMKSRAHVSIFLTGVNEPRKFSSEFEVPCPFVKLFHLKQFAIYGI